MRVSFFNKSLRHVIASYRDWQTDRFVNSWIEKRNALQPEDFDFYSFKSKVVGFIHAMQINGTGVHYRYSDDCTKPTLYASAYACMTLSILGELRNYTDAQKRAWVDYFDSFQHHEDGLFYDPIVMNELFPDTDWWGARHLALHMISAYTDLGARPKYPFSFLDQYYDLDHTKSWLDSFNWRTEAFEHANDVDNKLMNIGCLLQYQRDHFADTRAAETIIFIRDYLYSKLNKKTGLWGNYNPQDPAQRSRMIQFAYHLFPLFFYDDSYAFDFALIIDHVLNTQNKYGGFGVQSNSSACEDIDSIDILIKLYHLAQENRKLEIDTALQRALRWVLHNQTDDGGFVFKLNEQMIYGHHEMSSSANSGAMFPTWFRVLSIAYMMKHKHNCFVINRAPGLVF